MSKGTIEYLKHIRDECLYIISEIEESEVNKAAFVKNETNRKLEI